MSNEFKNRLQLTKNNRKYLEWKVNVFHQHGHKADCADEHSLRITKNCGMFTGEDIETGWAKLNHVQYSSREMDAGARVDTITSHMLQINLDKIMLMGRCLCNL